MSWPRGDRPDGQVTALLRDTGHSVGFCRDDSGSEATLLIG